MHRTIEAIMLPAMHVRCHVDVVPMQSGGSLLVEK
jgi:hypothetical protein